MIPPEWVDQFLVTRAIDGRGLCGVQRFLFTCGLLTDLTFDCSLSYGYSARYCYPNVADALHALATWDGQGDPPAGWIKEKVSGRAPPADE